MSETEQNLKFSMRVQWETGHGEQREDLPISLFFLGHKIYAVVALDDKPRLLVIEKSDQYKGLYYGWEE